MADKQPPPTQETAPRSGEPLEIPMPKKADVLRDLAKAAKPSGGGTEKK